MWVVYLVKGCWLLFPFQIVSDPSSFDVMVMPNLYGDILRWNINKNNKLFNKMIWFTMGTLRHTEPRRQPNLKLICYPKHSSNPQICSFVLKNLQFLRFRRVHLLIGKTLILLKITHMVQNCMQLIKMH